MNKHLAKLESAHNLLISTINKVESELSSKIEFKDYSIFYQFSDGFVLEYEANNALLRHCIEIINIKGRLSLDDYMELTR